ncbi:hypothetical protein HN51_069743, partial [Arachis hypogaea]
QITLFSSSWNLYSNTSPPLASLILSARLFGLWPLFTAPLLTSRVITPRLLPHLRLSLCYCTVHLLYLCRWLAAKIASLLASPFFVVSDEELRM